MDRPAERTFPPDARQIAPPRAARLLSTSVEFVTNPDACVRLRVIARRREREQRHMYARACAQGDQMHIEVGALGERVAAHQTKRVPVGTGLGEQRQLVRNGQKCMRLSTPRPFETPRGAIRNREGGFADGHDATRAPEGRGCRKRRRRVCLAMAFGFTRRASHQVALQLRHLDCCYRSKAVGGGAQLRLCNTSSKSRCREAAKAKEITVWRDGSRADLMTQPLRYFFASAGNFPTADWQGRRGWIVPRAPPH